MAVPRVADEITVEQYLSTSYRPDCDYVDDRLEERNLGEYDHARIETLLAIWFGAHERDWGIRVIVEQRVQVSESRFRVPDVCVLSSNLPIEQIVHHPPLVCIEVLSPEDSIHRMRERVADYHGMGVENVWLIDPASREGITCSQSGWNNQDDGKFTVPGSPIYVDLAEIFARLA